MFEVVTDKLSTWVNNNSIPSRYYELIIDYSVSGNRFIPYTGATLHTNFLQKLHLKEITRFENYCNNKSDIVIVLLSGLII
jgi:hypothetical protein